MKLDYCPRCWHTHNVGGPCVTECADCEAELSEELGELGSLNVAATEPEHGQQLDETPPELRWPRPNDRRRH